VSRDVDVNQAVDNVFSMIGRQLEAHNIDVQKNLDKNVPRIKTELNRLEQVIMNLVVNARQALDASSRDAKKLWVKTGMQKKIIQIEVVDNALGIPADLTGKIFDPFFTTKDVGQGTGLGLTISQSIVAEFKGQLKVFNNESGGATFIVSAPAAGGPP
jgi:C4-dicarboxylate-specific signal transduction histidine kinase